MEDNTSMKVQAWFLRFLLFKFTSETCWEGHLIVDSARAGSKQ